MGKDQEGPYAGEEERAEGSGSDYLSSEEIVQTSSEEKGFKPGKKRKEPDKDKQRPAKAGDNQCRVQGCFKRARGGDRVCCCHGGGNCQFLWMVDYECVGRKNGQ